MYVITNGAEHIRYYRSGINKFFSDIFTPERTGCDKPSVEYFNAVKKFTGIDYAETLIIGDSLTSDMKGGNNAGIDTCWYNPSGAPNNTDIVCTYTVNNYDGIRRLLLS